MEHFEAFCAHVGTCWCTQFAPPRTFFRRVCTCSVLVQTISVYASSTLGLLYREDTDMKVVAHLAWNWPGVTSARKTDRGSTMFLFLGGIFVFLGDSHYISPPPPLLRRSAAEPNPQDGHAPPRSSARSSSSPWACLRGLVR